MNVMVTGASGFLGNYVVAELLRQRYRVRAVVRPATPLNVLPWSSKVEVCRADLRSPAFDATALCGIDFVIHLAAVVQGDANTQFAATITATENLLRAMELAGVNNMVLGSSMAVYDWRRTRRVLDEDAPLESGLYRRDEYAVAKTWQERLATRFAQKCGGRLVILRPGFLWGPGREWVDGVGVRCGRFILVNGPFRRLPLSYVENCARCFAEAIVQAKSGIEVANVVDDDRVRAWRHAHTFVRCAESRHWRIPLPYHVACAFVGVTHFIGRLILGPRMRLPGLLSPTRYTARFKSLRFPNTKLRGDWNWLPGRTYAECVDCCATGDVGMQASSTIESDAVSGVPSPVDA